MNSKKKHLISKKFQQGGTADKINRVNWTGLMNDPTYKANFGWKIDPKAMAVIEDSLVNRQAGFPQRMGVLSQVVAESGGSTKDHGNGAAGLIGWRGERKKNLPSTLAGQAHKLMEELYTKNNGNAWSHGGEGTHVNSGEEMRQLFLGTKNVNQATKAVMKGLVRPEQSVWDKRLRLVPLLRKYSK